MIQSASTPELQTEFLRRIAHKPYFESTLGTHLHLFGSHPASGWAFYLLPGSAVLELRGGSAVLCGTLPGAPRRSVCCPMMTFSCEVLASRPMMICMAFYFFSVDSVMSALSCLSAWREIGSWKVKRS